MAAGAMPAVAATEVTPSLPGLAALGAMQLGVCRVEAAGAPFPKVPGMHPAVLCAGILATVLLPASAIGCRFVATEGCRGPVQAKVLTPQHLATSTRDRWTHLYMAQACSKSSGR
jgi:hypothetical protein